MIDNFTGQLEMLSASNLSGTPVVIGPAFTNPSDVAVDGARQRIRELQNRRYNRLCIAG